MNIIIGYDNREHEAYRVACRSLAQHCDIMPQPLCIDRLQSCGLLNRAVDNRGTMYDLASNAPCSTEFAVSRFLTPIICQSGWALFVDCDVVFMSDPRELFRFIDNSKAVMVVKHSHAGAEELKMDGQPQTQYFRKNWSSVMLFNCDHPSNQRLSVRDINERPGRDLHRFYWLDDFEIGELPAEWNWLVGVQPKPENPKIAHFTLGGPWIDGWKKAEHDNIWLEAALNG